ncbi:MAG: TonB-dependent receptor [Bacteroidales bacterium]|nr:TonB-dependent receptor [Bacteroidales bacterium]
MAFNILISLLQPVQSQISVKVTDAANQLPLGDVHVLASGNVLGITNQNGIFEIQTTQAHDTLTFKRLGYQTKSISISGDSTLLVSLKAQSTDIEGVAIQADHYRSEAFRSMAPIEIVSKQQINQKALADPTPIFNSLPGLYAHAGAQNTHRITIRGVGARSMYSTTKIKAYLNGIPLTSGMGETTLEDLDLNMIDRITLVKGPSTTLYGSPLGGAILYKAGPMNNTSSYLKTQNTAGSFGLMDNRLAFGWRGDKTSLELSLNRYSKNGFRQNDDYNRRAFTLVAQHYFDENTSITYIGRLHDLKAYIPSSVDRQTFLDQPANAASNWLETKGYEDYYKLLNGLSLYHRFSSRINLQTSLFHRNYNGYERRPFNVLDDNTSTVGVRGVLNIRPEWLSQKSGWDIGFEAFYDDYTWKTRETLPQDSHGQTLTDNRQKRFYYNVFTTFRTSWKKISLDAGFNVNKTGYDYIDNFSDSVDYSTSHGFGWILSPRLSLGYRVGEKLNVFATLSHGFSAPSYEEAIDSEGFANTELEAEKGWSRELGLKLRLWRDKVFFKANYFSMDINNLLVTKRLAEDQYTKINAGKTRHNGIEVNARVELQGSKHFSGRVNMTYAYSDFKFLDFKDEGETFDGNPIPGIPEHKLYTSLDFTVLKNYFIHTGLLWVDGMPMNDANTLYSDDYHRLNLKTGWKKKVTPKWQIEIYGGIRNVTDIHYASMILVNAVGYGDSNPRYFYPAAPVNYYGGFSVSYFFDNFRITKNK